MIQENTEYQNLSLMEIIQKSQQGPIFNNAAQIANHSFFWECLTPEISKRQIPSNILDLINRDFGDLETFKEQFSMAAAKNFGSGWTWLLLNDEKKLTIESTSNANTPFSKSGSHKTLMTIDVWEHAYYIDYRNVRPDYIKAFWELINWQFVNNQLT